jgi:FkbM family methyltransferase
MERSIRGFLMFHLRRPFVFAKFLRAVIPKRFRPIGYLEQLAETHTGRRVAKGPFAGMRCIVGSVGSAYIPKLLGIYERELNGCVEKACALNFPLIVDIGAAEGYYAVGLARRNPKARVVAFEMAEKGRAALREMAGLNGVEVIEETSEVGCLRSEPSRERGSEIRNLILGAKFRTPSAALFLDLHGKCEFENLQAALASADRSLVVCDVEGHEEFLLVPEKIPALARAHLLVEMHDCFRPGLTELITERFAPTHYVERILQEPRTRADLPYRTLGTALLPGRYLDWAVSEWRPMRMSWLWMRPKIEDGDQNLLAFR